MRVRKTSSSPMIANGFDNFNKGNYGAAALDFAGALGRFSQLLRACFAAGTPLLTPTGEKAIEQFRPGALILAAPEDDPEGRVEIKQVGEVFENHARLLNV